MKAKQPPTPKKLSEAKVRKSFTKLLDTLAAFKDAECEFALMLYDAGYCDEESFCEAMRTLKPTMAELNDHARYVSNYSDRTAFSLFAIAAATRRRAK